MGEDLNTAATRMAQCLRMAGRDSAHNSKTTDTVVLTLMGIHPTKFVHGALPIPLSLIVTPDGVGFDAKDVGKQFLFLKSEQGLKYILLAKLGVKK